MRPSTMARLALCVILVGLVAVVTYHLGLNFLLGLTAFVAVTFGLGGLIAAASGAFDQ